MVVDSVPSTKSGNIIIGINLATARPSFCSDDSLTRESQPSGQSLHKGQTLVYTWIAFPIKAGLTNLQKGRTTVFTLWKLQEARSWLTISLSKCYKLKTWNIIYRLENEYTWTSRNSCMGTVLINKFITWLLADTLAGVAQSFLLKLPLLCPT